MTELEEREVLPLLVLLLDVVLDGLHIFLSIVFIEGACLELGLLVGQPILRTFFYRHGQAMLSIGIHQEHHSLHTIKVYNLAQLVLGLCTDGDHQQANKDKRYSFHHH